MCYLEVVDTFITFICVISFLWWAELAMEWCLAARAGKDLAALPETSMPLSLSVIVPARNEEKNIYEALGSLLRALPAGGEVLFINDRSTDKTGAIARLLAREDDRLQVFDVTELPEGWLGKTNAMQLGYRASRGDYLLFTDADVHFRPGCLERAMALCVSDGVDHLVATPFMITRGFWERVFVSYFSILLVSRFRIWRASIPGSRFFAGIGAFNLVNRTAYEKAGTHAAIRHEVVDDLLLGSLIKKAGGKQQVVSGEKCLQVRWNEGVSGLIQGLEKNAYAGFEYKPLHALAGCLAVLLMTILPALLPVLFVAHSPVWISGWALAAALGVWFSFAILYVLAVRASTAVWLYFLTFPLGSAMLVWAIVRSMVFYYLRGGVKWRETVYKSPKPNRLR